MFKIKDDLCISHNARKRMVFKFSFFFSFCFVLFGGMKRRKSRVIRIRGHSREMTRGMLANGKSLVISHCLSKMVSSESMSDLVVVITRSKFP